MAVDGWAVTFGTARGDCAELQPAQAPPQMLQPTRQQPMYQSPYCCVMVRCCAVANVNIIR